MLESLLGSLRSRSYTYTCKLRPQTRGNKTYRSSHPSAQEKINGICHISTLPLTSPIYLFNVPTLCSMSPSYEYTSSQIPSFIVVAPPVLPDKYSMLCILNLASGVSPSQPNLGRGLFVIEDGPSARYTIPSSTLLREEEPDG